VMRDQIDTKLTIGELGRWGTGKLADIGQLGFMILGGDILLAGRVDLFFSSWGSVPLEYDSVIR
jgi:hypothetical protein